MAPLAEVMGYVAKIVGVLVLWLPAAKRGPPGPTNQKRDLASRQWVGGWMSGFSVSREWSSLGSVQPYGEVFKDTSLNYSLGFLTNHKY